MRHLNAYELVRAVTMLQKGRTFHHVAHALDVSSSVIFVSYGVSRERHASTPEGLDKVLDALRHDKKSDIWLSMLCVTVLPQHEICKTTLGGQPDATSLLKLYEKKERKRERERKRNRKRETEKKETERGGRETEREREGERER